MLSYSACLLCRIKDQRKRPCCCEKQKNGKLLCKLTGQDTRQVLLHRDVE